MLSVECFPKTMIPCVCFEDEHLLVVNKPPGWNTHAPSPYAGEGIYDWLKHREPRWANLAIIHRLDKETSGVMVFGKTPLANRSLTEQFTERRVRKTYTLLTDQLVSFRSLAVESALVRIGERYHARPVHAGGKRAETHFSLLSTNDASFVLPGTTKSIGGGILKRQISLVLAQPVTGRPHQIRVHAFANGFPILGDSLYGGSPFPRVCLHAAELTLRHPATAEDLTFRAPADFETDPRSTLRAAVIEPEATDSFRLIHGASDGWPEWFVDQLGPFLLSQSEQPLTPDQQARLTALGGTAYHKRLSRQVRGSTRSEVSSSLVRGDAAPDRFMVLENGVQFELSFNEGYSVGLFLDQRDNRRRLQTGYVAAGFPPIKSEVPDPKPEVLNCFAYTCGFSVCAALGGARTTSLDLSKKYLEWGKRNFALNGLDSAAHDFIYGDTFDWLRRLAKKKRVFDTVLLDPPTFSQSKESGVFRAEKDYGKLVTAALPVLKRGGILFASTNAAAWPPENFLAQVSQAIRKAGRTIVRQHYVPQPPDFPISRAEPAYLKTVWLRVE